jgi:hypothetical protein
MDDTWCARRRRSDVLPLTPVPSCFLRPPPSANPVALAGLYSSAREDRGPAPSDVCSVIHGSFREVMCLFHDRRQFFPFAPSARS